MYKSALVLAAGQGTRIKSNLPKVLHKVCGKEMVNADALKNLFLEFYQKYDMIEEISFNG